MNNQTRYNRKAWPVAAPEREYVCTKCDRRLEVKYKTNLPTFHFPAPNVRRDCKGEWVLAKPEPKPRKRKNK
jgi:uncharacterized protein YlaI